MGRLFSNVLVTGASSGIGAATATLFLERGYTVYAAARKTETLHDLRDRGTHVLPLDVTREGSILAAVSAVEAEAGQVDILINNAGYGLNGPLEELALSDVRTQFETNVFGLLRLSQRVLPGMRRAGRGRIINVGSVGGSFTAPGAGAYHATKYALEALSDALRMEVRPFGVDVVLVKPTGVHSAFAGKIAATIPDTGADSPYLFFKHNFVRVVEQMFTGNAPGIVSAPEVARALLHAAEEKRPRARYVAGASGYAYLFLRRVLTDAAWDALMARQFPVLPPVPNT